MFSQILAKFKANLFKDINAVPDVLKPGYYPFFDGIRAIAILIVVGGHLVSHSKYFKFIDGAIGVHLFYILSGFLITTLLFKEKIKYGNVSFKKFYVRRVLRIFPVAYLFVAVLIVLNIVFNLKVTTLSFLTTLAYLKNFPFSNDWYTGHFWTLSVEEQFYLMGTILLMASTNKYIRLSILLFVTIPILDYVAFNNLGIFYTNKLVHIATYIVITLFGKGTLYILAGSLLSILIFKGLVRLDRFKKHYYLSFILLISAILIHEVFAGPNYIWSNISTTVFTVLILVVIALNLNTDNFLNKILSTPWLVMVGKLSYSIYIWQQLFTVNRPWANSFKYANSPLLNMIALFIVAYISYAFYEVKFLKLKDRFSRKLAA
jgi:peptidoglycan/LPS O-acetylase OafA/YrhL